MYTLETVFACKILLQVGFISSHSSLVLSYVYSKQPIFLWANTGVVERGVDSTTAIGDLSVYPLYALADPGGGGVPPLNFQKRGVTMQRGCCDKHGVYSE